jgi:uncharacterized membrane protein
MNALQAYKKVEKAATILAWGWLLNNFLSLVSILALIYLIWCKWHLEVLTGTFVLLAGIWIINFVLLPALFSLINKPFAEMAKSGVVKLAVLGVINDELVKQLADKKVEYWPKIIASSMTAEEFRQKIFGIKDYVDKEES